MKAAVIIFSVLCSSLLFHSTKALPFEDSIEVGDAILIDLVPVEKPEEKPESIPGDSSDISIDASIQSTAHIEVPEPVAEQLVKAMIEAFHKMNISGEANVQRHISKSEEHLAKDGEHHSRSKRATCDLMDASGWSKTLCAAHCILLGHLGGYCNGRSVCQCRD